VRWSWKSRRAGFAPAVALAAEVPLAVDLFTCSCSYSCGGQLQLQLKYGNCYGITMLALAADGASALCYAAGADITPAAPVLLAFAVAFLLRL
jgi:hypothetical protein